MSASNFFGDWAMHTRFFFVFVFFFSPWNTDHHGATVFCFFFKETQRGIFMNKVTFPKADKPGLMSV